VIVGVQIIINIIEERHVVIILFDLRGRVSAFLSSLMGVGMNKGLVRVSTHNLCYYL